MAPRDTKTRDTDEHLPFGAIASPTAGGRSETQDKAPAKRGKASSEDAAERGPEPGSDPADGDANRKDWRKQENRRGSARRGGRRRGRRRTAEDEGGASSKTAGAATDASPGANGANGADRATETERRERVPAHEQDGGDGSARPAKRRRRRRRGRGADDGPRGERPDRPRDPQDPAQGTSERPQRDGDDSRDGAGQAQRGRSQQEPRGPVEVEGMLLLTKTLTGTLRSLERHYLPSKDDVFVSQKLVTRHKLRAGSVVKGLAVRGGPQKLQLQDVQLVDGKDPREWGKTAAFKKLTSIDPDFHYALGNEMNELSLKIVDLLCPIGRGTRGLIVAPPRSGKTILMQQFAKGIEKVYPEVNLFVLLVDERPEEATEWTRTITGGKVFVSTNDESPKNHVELAEAVWARCMRLVEIGEDVVLLLDSITRLARAYNNVNSGTGRTLSGGLDTRALERPKQFFGSARNTETAGSLTILGTTLIETGSRMDQVIFEEFKGTGNMELVLSRKLADRRIFPAIDLERSGTRKEEKLLSRKRLHQIQVLRRVLTKMHFAEAMELLITKLDDVEHTDDFLKRFEVDPEA